ncbi:YadA C-terminal domain-containing protein [uncultured Sneathia sp.]|nr:YadA C-terminal domain-containing protein [uncultured Sneathia sp.]
MKTDLALNGSAAAIAIGNLGSISSNSNRQFQLSAAYGFFGGKHAVALGFSGISNNDRFTYRLSGAVTGNGNLAFGAGAGILFGEKRNTNANYEQLKKEIEELRRMINNR